MLKKKRKRDEEWGRVNSWSLSGHLRGSQIQTLQRGAFRWKISSVCAWGLVSENWREVGLLGDEHVPLELGRDMWMLGSHLGVQHACVLSEAPVSPLLIDPQKELTSWWTSQMNGSWKLCEMKWGTEQKAFKTEGGTQTTRGEPRDSEKLNYLI